MSMECSECESDLRCGHADQCSRNPHSVYGKAARRADAFAQRARAIHKDMTGVAGNNHAIREILIRFQMEGS